ncbi:MAG: cell division protein SepF [Firmicutes bacterium]|nr:cell division protein SepF [Bacillota bacterium]
MSSDWSDWLNGAANFDPKKDKAPEFYEDAHRDGRYKGRAAAADSMPLPDNKQSVMPRQYQNFVVYKPKNPEDVQRLIDYLKRREPAIINLDDTAEDVAQRILDFVSGATYALSGSVHRIVGNIFLLSPEGVEITVPYENDRD